MEINKSIVLLVLSVLISSFSQVLLKKSSEKEYRHVIYEYLNWRVILGYGMLVGSMLITILAFRGTDYKNGPMIESLGYVFVMILSRIFFKEPITKKKILGNGLILLGILVFNC